MCDRAATLKTDGGRRRHSPRIQQGARVFEFLSHELPASTWEISKLTDVDRHKLSQRWQTMAQAYERTQFHVRRHGLALLVAYLLHLIDLSHATIPA